MLKTIAVDDEPIALEIIKKFLTEAPYIELVAHFTNAKDAMTFMHENKVDLIFLDIKMPVFSGIDLLKSMPTLPLIIITTGYTDYAVQSFDLNVIDYLLKPFSLARFLKAVNRAYELHKLKSGNEEKQDSVFVKSGYEKVRVELEGVLYIESLGNYVRFVFIDKKITARLTMAEAEELLPQNEFIRIHRSFIVKKASIDKHDKKNVWIRKIELPIGSAYLNMLDSL